MRNSRSESKTRQQTWNQFVLDLSTDVFVFVAYGKIKVVFSSLQSHGHHQRRFILQWKPLRTIPYFYWSLRAFCFYQVCCQCKFLFLLKDLQDYNWYWEIISLAFLGMFNLGINHEGNSQFTTAGDLVPKFMLSPLSLGRVVFCTFSGLFNRGSEIDMPFDKIPIWYFGLFNRQFYWDRLS